MILHIVNKSPFNSDCLASCLRMIGPDDALLLIEDGVYAAAHPAPLLQALDAAVPVYALDADLAARGLQELLSARVEPLDDGAFVDLTVAYPKSQSWY